MKSTVSLIILAIGIVWQYGQKIPNLIGNILDVVNLGDFITDFQLWLVNNPNLSNTYGPWILMGGAAVSLVFVHLMIPLYRRWATDDLSIIFDPADQEGQFGGVGKWHVMGSPDPPLDRYIFRVGVKNNTAKTIYDVTGTVEGEAVDQPFPVALRFSRTRELEGNLDPKRMLLMDMFALPPDQTEWMDGIHEFTVRINGRDTSEVSQEFQLDKTRMPAVYLKS